MGRPRFPDRTFVETIRQASVPLLRTERLACGKVEDVNMVTLKLALTKNEVTLVELLPVHAEAQPYAGLDDSLITSYS
ncbi:Beta-xylosidase [compost metagenome]